MLKIHFAKPLRGTIKENMSYLKELDFKIIVKTSQETKWYKKNEQVIELQIFTFSMDL